LLLGLVDGTNTENLCGGNNWRVPTAEELESIVDLSIIKLTIDSDYFPDATAMVDVGAVSGITICTTTISFYFPNQSCYIVSHARPFSACTFCASTTYYPCLNYQFNHQHKILFCHYSR
jgi:hypothetical protein